MNEKKAPSIKQNSRLPAAFRLLEFAPFEEELAAVPAAVAAAFTASEEETVELFVEEETIEIFRLDSEGPVAGSVVGPCAGNERVLANEIIDEAIEEIVVVDEFLDVNEDRCEEYNKCWCLNLDRKR